MGSLAVLHVSVFAHNITVGTTQIAIPAPSGYALVTDDMQPFASAATRYVPPEAQQFALFLPDAAISVAATGGMPRSARRLSVQTPKGAIKDTISEAFFTTYKHIIRTQIDGVAKSLSSKKPDALNKLITQASTSDSVERMEILSSTIIPFPLHHESAKSVAYSSLIQTSYRSKPGSSVVHEYVATVTSIYLCRKMINLVVYAEKSGLEWSRAEAKEWAEMVLAANPESSVMASGGHTLAETVVYIIGSGFAGILCYVWCTRAGILSVKFRR